MEHNLRKAVVDLLLLVDDLRNRAGLDLPRVGTSKVAGPVERARAEYTNRRVRGRVFSEFHIFGEPSWDILLHLFISDAEGNRESVKAVIGSAGVPDTTASRHLKVLEAMNLVEYAADHHDKRRRFVSLTPRGRNAMLQHFQDLESRASLETL